MSFSFSDASFSDRRDSYAPSLASSLSMSLDTPFSSAFSTPADDQQNPFEHLHDYSSFSSRSVSPMEQIYDMSMASNMLMADSNMMFSTPTKSLLGPSLMSYDYPYVADDSQSYMTSPPELQYDHGSSPLGAMYTPSRIQGRQFVDPAATFLGSYEPSTPMHSSQMSLQSPTTIYPSSSLTYFISPVQQKFEQHTPSPFEYSPEEFSSSRRSSSSASTMNSSAVLHRVTNSGKVRKQSSKSGNAIGFVPEGKYKCHHLGCKSEHAFKRQEHLKRHMKTHQAQKDLQCAYCPKKFQQDRSDNYRSHVRLHAKKDSKGSRTRYYPAAELEVITWEKDRSRGSARELAPLTPVHSLTSLLSEDSEFQDDLQY